MVSIAGGKLTTHRRIALAALSRITDSRMGKVGRVDGALADASERTWFDAAELEPEMVAHLVEIYGSEAATVVAQRRLHDNAMERIHPDGPDVWAQAFHATDREWATTVDDIVRRRTTLAVRGLATTAVRAEIKRRTAVTA